MSLLLGISGYYHDAAACLLRDGEIVAASQEERFTRKKHDPRFPKNAIQYCLDEAKVDISKVDAVVFYDKPFLTFERLLETYVQFAPRGFSSFVQAMPVWLKEKLFQRLTIERELKACFPDREIPKILFAEHHQSHAASAFFPSPFQEAAVLCMDGVGEWATTTAWMGRDNQLTPLWEQRFPHSLGLLYSAFTYYAGFKVNSGEYKIMGLAPYGRPVYVQAIYDQLMDLKSDGTFRLNLDYFDYCTGTRMTNKKFDQLFGGPPRAPESRLTQKEMDLARSVQVVTEEVVLRLAKKVHAETGAKALCMAGGVALNCVANGRLLREGPFRDVWVQPAAGDAGGAVGAALAAWHQHFKKPRQAKAGDSMKGGYLGPRFSNASITEFLKQKQIPFTEYSDDELLTTVATALAGGQVIGWFQGRMEFGPRALGARSILGDPRSQSMQTTMNLKIKFRESFRPFAPSVLRERVSDFFELDADSPYMLLVADVTQQRRRPLPNGSDSKWGIDLLNMQRSEIPAVTHVDYSARVQTIHRETNPRYYDLVRRFDELTGCPAVVNTSFNVRGEPIVCSPEDAYRCFMRTEIDMLVLENCVLRKSEQKPLAANTEWMKEFELD